ncbi:toprim domain-containing protein [Salinimicrobium sediminilitoris]|uniref:toprim domain-containing protein n=1 Tax=Salinimicrobium sediminilitoris TaxID=2876715 RepID=UPI001E61A9AD|nr:bifunctional DNA primase/helicase [Salinimicrobium sediminilitoris]MCC8360603.1 toprim domain-containing protein [Salinimicrobium sediminilitoris]
MMAWSEIDTKGRTTGQIKVKCPACIDRRTNKRDTSLSVNLDTGMAKCHYCNEKSFRESGISNKLNKSYLLPEQKWKNYTSISEEFVRYFEKRGINQSTVIDNRITEEIIFQPALGRKVPSIVFNYFEGDTIVNKKYRSIDKKFTQSPGTKNIFYGLNDILESDEIYIVEGEMDKLALWEIGIKNVISVPNGANDNDDVWENAQTVISGVKKFYIATDCDEKGQNLSEKIAQRLGRWKCARVVFNNKDANGDLMEGREVLEEAIASAKPYPLSGTYTVEDLFDPLMALYNNGTPDTLYPKKSFFGPMKEVFSTMKGHLVTVTGIPSHGKSNFLDWYVLNLINDYDLKASWFSPEHHPMALHQSTLIEKVTGKAFDMEKAEKLGCERVSAEEILKYKEWANEKIYLTGPEGSESPTWDWLLDRFKEQMYSYGIDIFIIDAFNKVLFKDKGNKYDLINTCLTELTSFAQRNNVIIFLVAHPTKMQKNEQTGAYNIPSLYDVSGSADFRNQTHDGFTIYRNFGDQQLGTQDSTDFYNMKTKFSFQGNINGRVNFKYHLPSGRYYAADYNFQNESFLDQSKVDNSNPSNLPSNLIPNPRPDRSCSSIEAPWDSPEDEIPF